MPDRRILKDKVFLYHYVCEVDYVAEYEKYTVSGCSLQHHNGVGRTQYATTPECNARLYIFDQNTTVVDSEGRKRKFIEPDKYEALKKRPIGRLHRTEKIISEKRTMETCRRAGFLTTIQS